MNALEHIGSTRFIPPESVCSDPQPGDSVPRQGYCLLVLTLNYEENAYEKTTAKNAELTPNRVAPALPL